MTHQIKRWAMKALFGMAFPVGFPQPRLEKAIVRKNTGRNAVVLSMALVLPIALGGCAAAVIPFIIASAATSGYGIFKVVQTSSGGSVEIAVNDSQVTAEQRAQLKRIKSIAVWPEKGGGSVTFAETLSEGGRFEVISPARVSAELRKLGLPDDLKQMTSIEAKDVFYKICQATKADALVSAKETGGNINTNIWSLERANQTREYIEFVYSRHANDFIAQIPVTLKILMGGKMPTTEELSRITNTEVAKKLVALSQ